MSRLQNSIDVWDELDFHPVNECLEDYFIDPCTIVQDANHEMQAKRGNANGSRPRVRRRRRPQSDDDSSTQSTSKTRGHWWPENPSSHTDGRMEPKDGVDLACAS